MTTSRLPPNYYTSDEFTYGNNTNRFIPHENDSHVSSNNRGIITQTKKDGSYNIIEKDFGDHKVIYHIPVEYGDNFDISALEDIPPVDEQQQQQQQPQQQQLNNSPRLVRRRIIQQYNDFDATDDYEYVEEIPAPRRVYDSSRRPNDASNRTRVVYELQQQPPPPPQTIEYVYDDDNTYFLDTRPQIEEEVEYLVREPEPRTTYIEEPQPTRRSIYVPDPSVPVSSPRPLPPPAPPSPRHSRYQPSPRLGVPKKLPSPLPTKPIRRKNTSPPVYEPPIKPNVPKPNEQPLRLMDVVAQNRARRGGRIPKPRREVDEEKVYDKPTYQRNIIKNGFIVHK